MSGQHTAPTREILQALIVPSMDEMTRKGDEAEVEVEVEAGDDDGDDNMCRDGRKDLG